MTVRALARADFPGNEPVSYNLGSAFMMANIAPSVVHADASDSELVLYATLAAFQIERFPGKSESWPGARLHLQQAFIYARKLGRANLARKLLEDVVADSRRDPDGLDRDLLNRSFKGDSSQLAAHDAEMAAIRNRDVRAAALLDPTIDLDQILLE